MIQDITRIREELEGYVEVTLPYEFAKDIHVKYLTLKKNHEDESFYPGGCYQGLGNNCIFMSNSYKRWSVPICYYTKDGQVRYQTRFFIPEHTTGSTTGSEAVSDTQTHETLRYQQEIIEKLVAEIKETRQMRKSLLEEKQTYEEMLQKNRYRLKELSVENRDKDKQIQTYKDIIQKLSQSHPLMSR